MRLSSKIIPLALMAGAFAAPALADEMQMKPGQMMMMGTDGKMTTMQMEATFFVTFSRSASFKGSPKLASTHCRRSAKCQPFVTLAPGPVTTQTPEE